MKFVLLKKRSVVKFTLMFIVLALAVTGVTLTGAAQVYNGVSSRKLPIFSVSTDEKVVALSFDACYGNENTQSILQTLTTHNVVANYFVAGTWAQTYSDDLMSLSESERIEIGSHSNTHPNNIQKLSAKKMELEIATGNEIIENVTGKKIELFRAPNGQYSNSLLSVTQKMGLYSIQYDVDSLDQSDVSASEITANILNNVQNGSIILLHNDGKNTLAALPAIIEGLKNKGYSFKTIGDLIYKDSYTIDKTGKQIRR